MAAIDPLKNDEEIISTNDTEEGIPSQNHSPYADDEGHSEIKDENDIDSKQEEKEGQIKLIIYDFDQTITKVHLYRELHGGKLNALSKVSDDELISIFGGNDRIKSLNKHFVSLTNAHIEFAIISFGWTQVIKTSLDRLNLGKYFENKLIIGRDSKEIIMVNRNKGRVIERLMEKRNLKYDEVLFVDDALSNIEQTSKICATLHVKTRNGITDDDMDAIENEMYVYNEDELIEIEKEKMKMNENKNDNHHRKRKSKLSKYRITDVPQWFEDLHRIEDDTAVIQVEDDDANNQKEVKIAAKFTLPIDDEYPE